MPITHEINGVKTRYWDKEEYDQTVRRAIEDLGIPYPGKENVKNISKQIFEKAISQCEEDVKQQHTERLREAELRGMAEAKSVFEQGLVRQEQNGYRAAENRYNSFFLGMNHGKLIGKVETEVTQLKDRAKLSEQVKGAWGLQYNAKLHAPKIFTRRFNLFFAASTLLTVSATAFLTKPKVR